MVGARAYRGHSGSWGVLFMRDSPGELKRQALSPLGQEVNRRLRCGLTLFADPHQFQTCSGHSITKGLLVTKQPLPYLLYLPSFLSNLA